MSDSPLLLIGLDGVDFRYLDQFSELLPRITGLRERGTEASLRSTHPPWTASAWPSLYTGVDPSHHGVYDFFAYTGAYPDDASVVTRQDVRAPAIWNYLTHQDLRSIVMNVPVTHPVDELDGIQLPGYLAPHDEPGYPPGIREELGEAVEFPYRIYSEHETDSAGANKIDGYESLIEQRGIAAEHLLETNDWEFAFVQVQKTDAVFHNSSSMTDFREIYRTADELVGRVIDAAPEPPNVVLCSDHGMGPVDGYTIYINEMLKDEGYIETTAGDTSQRLESIKATEATETSPTLAVDQLARLGRRVGLGPERIYRIARRLSVSTQLRAVVPDSVERSLERGVDWRQSAAYCRRPSEQGIRINLQGREPDGVVPAENYDSVRDEIIDVLSRQTTPSGDRLFEFVCRREEIYEGPYADEACDILFRTAGMNHKISTSLPGLTMAEIDTYSHKPNGVFIAAGPDINAAWSGHQLSLIDVAPLLCTLLGQPIPDRMTGQPPADLTPLDDTTAAYETLAVETGEYSQDQSEVTDRLEDLGYL